jgi:hypothetical protein
VPVSVFAFRQRRKTVTSAMLGAWFFALFVGSTDACGWIEPGAGPLAAVAGNPNEHERSLDANPPGRCEQFCKTWVPIVTKLSAISDQPDAQPLIVPVHAVSVALVLPPALRLAPAVHPPSGVPPFLRFVQLRL